MKCPSCGNENRDEARFCDSCGATLAEAAPEATARTVETGEVMPTPPGSPTEIAGRYKVSGYLGQGGRKRVYLGQDSEADREVAVAIFDTEGATASIGARARREAQAMGKLAGHPHVVDVYDTGEQDGNPYIVSEYMAGGDVEGLLDTEAHRRLEVARTIEIATDVARALEHAHGRGIVHRDIKPANVWLAEDGSARLGDFGLATTEGRSRVSQSGTLVGTVAYLPPEQALGQSSGPRSDLYSLGALIYEMLTGQPPFAGDDAVAIISQHINADPLPPSQQNPQVSRALDALVLDLLAKREADRPAGAAEVRERLSAAAGEPPVSEEVEKAANPLDSLAGGIFVGREAELEELRGELDEAAGGRGRLVMLVGEPGVGKTRTVEELATYAQVRGVPVHWGRCRDEEGAPAYWPWVQAIRSYVRDADPVALAWHLGGGAADVAQLVPELAERLGGVPEAPELEGEEARFRLFDSVMTFLTAASRDRPMMIVLDDLHWADEPSLLLLKFAARELAGSGLMIVGTYRDVELGRHHPLARVLAELGEAEGARRVTLRGLDAPAVSRYIEMVSGIEPPPQLVEQVHAQTEGNPFFVSEVVRLLVSEGSLSEGGTAPGTSLAIPQGVREVVGRRLDQLSEDANQTLRVAAAIGREFDGRLVMKVADLPYERLESAADEAIAARLVVPSGGTRYSFAHALVRETLHDELSSTQRAKLHAEIAKAIEDHAEEAEHDHLGELAYHYLAAGAAGDPERAMDYASLAAGRAMEQHAYEEAAELQERALELFELDRDADPRRRQELLLELAGAQASSGQFPAARETLDKVVELARELGDNDSLVEAAIGLGRVTEVGYADEAIISAATDALEALGEGDSPQRAGLLATLSTEMLWLDLDQARELSTEALEMARRVDDPDILAGALHRQLIMEQQPSGSSEQRMQLLEEMKAVADRCSNREFLLRHHAFLLREYLELGDIDGADREIAAYEKVAKELRMPQHLWHVPLFRAMRAMIDGDLEAAERLGAEAQAGGRRAGEPIADQFVGIQLAQLRRLQGRADELLPVFREMTERYPAIPAWRTALAAGLALAGKVEEARVEFERIAANDFEGIPQDAQFRSAMALITEVCVAVGDSSRAGFLYEALEPVAEKVIVVGRAAMAQGPYARLLGLLAEMRGDRDEAERHFAAAVEITERMGDRPMLAWTKVDHASVLLGVIAAAAERDGEPNEADRDRALALLGEAIEVGREIGAAGLVDRALGLRLEAQGLSGVDITTSIDDVISAVESERPDLRAHAAPDGTVTILFSDIEDSTIHTERLGDERWLELLREHNTVFRERIASHDGYEVKSQGDGFMLAFPDPRRALECAIAVQQDFAARAAESAEDALRIRMGLHAGEVIAEEGDFFGKNVILAARIAGKATGGEILVSDSLKESVDEVAAAESSSEISFCDARELELKGLAGTHVVYRADWEPQGAAA